MALEFLKDIVGLIGAGVGIAQGFKGRDVPAGTNELIAAATRAAKFAEALNPNSELFKQIAGEEEQRIRDDTIEGLRFLTIEQNRATGRGMRGILNPERRDEAIAQATTRSFQGAKEQSRQQARDFLAKASRANAVSAVAFSPALKTGLAIDKSNRADFLNAVSATTDLAKEAFDWFDSPLTSTAQQRSNLSSGGRPAGLPGNLMFNYPR